MKAIGVAVVALTVAWCVFILGTVIRVVRDPESSVSAMERFNEDWHRRFWDSHTKRLLALTALGHAVVLFWGVEVLIRFIVAVLRPVVR